MTGGEPSSLRAVIRGSVQGVGFRWFAYHEARALGLVGGVRNLRDGTVEVVAEGPRNSLNAFLDALRRGPSGMGVSGVSEEWAPFSGQYKGFEIWPSR